MNAPVKNIAPNTSVYAKIAAVQAELAKAGIAKSRKNQTPGQTYNFRGIDEVYNTLSPLMAEAGLCILPRMVGHSLSERGKTSKGNAIFSAIVEAEFDFVSADDGSKHTVRSYGEAMDSSDKATNKAMSAAYKYMALMTFAIPTEGDNDADATTHEIVSEPQEMPPAEYAQIVNLLKATGVPADALLKEYRVKSIKLLNQQQYANAVERLNARLAEKAKAETNNAASGGFGELIDDEIPY